MNKTVTWRQALSMVEEMEDRHKPLTRYERNIINKAYVFGLHKQDLPPALSIMLENIYFDRQGVYCAAENGKAENFENRKT